MAEKWRSNFDGAKELRSGSRSPMSVTGKPSSSMTLIGRLKPKTFADYAKSLRKIAADIRGIKSGTDKFNPHTGGRQKWLEKVEAVAVAEITPEKIQKWKLSFLRRASSDPASQRRARISVNSLLRQAKSLFSKKVVRFLSFKLPTPRPFDGVEFEPRQTMRYHSTVDVKVLIKAAVDELARGEGDKRSVCHRYPARSSSTAVVNLQEVAVDWIPPSASIPPKRLRL